MPGRTISPTATEAIHKTETEEVFLVLLELSHALIVPPLRLVNNDVDITSNGNLFTAFPFEITLPNDEENIIPQAKLKIDNVDRQIVDVIRSIGTDPVDVLLQVVLVDRVRYSGNSLDTSSEDGIPRGITLSSDDSKMLMIGLVSKAIYEYDTPSGSLVGGSYTGNSLDISNEDAFMQGVALSSDDSKVFTVGVNTLRIYQYDLPAANGSVVGGSYSGNSFSVAGEFTIIGTAVALFLNSAGTRMFVVDNGKQTIHEYELPTPNIATGGFYTGNSFSVTNEMATVFGITLSSDETKMFLIGKAIGDFEIAREYLLGAPGTLASGASSTKNLAKISNEIDIASSGLTLTSDGSTLIIVGNIFDKAYEYNVPIPNSFSNSDASIELEYEGMKLKQVRYDANIVEGSLTIEGFIREPYPAGIFNPSFFTAI